MNQTGMSTEVKGDMRNKGAVGQQRNSEDRIWNDSKGRESVDSVFVVMLSYRGMSHEWGRRRRNECFWRRRLDMNRRRRSNRNRRVRLGWGEMEPARERGEVMRVGETMWGMGQRSDEAGEGTFDLITSWGRIRSELADSLKGDYEIVGVLKDNDLEMHNLWMFAWRVVRNWFQINNKRRPWASDSFVSPSSRRAVVKSMEEVFNRTACW
jgi:hypothetical protein